MNVFTIIVTYNAKRWLKWCLDSLYNSSIPTTPIIIDNCSNDDTVLAIRELYPKVVLLEQKENLGFGQANNIGINYALQHNASHLLLLNQDAAIEPHMIETLLEYDDKHTLLTPIHYNREGTHIDHNYYVKTILENAESNLFVEDLIIHSSLKESYDIDFVNAACWFIPIEIIKQIGGFNPLFIQYAEDNNFVQRLHYHHFTIKMIPAASAFHDRKRYGNENVYMKGLLYRKLLSLTTNINLSFTKRLQARYKIFLQYAGNSLVQHKIFSFMREWVRANCKLLANINHIRNSRKKEKQITTNWLRI